MTATDAMVTKIRRMIAEPTSATYDDDTLKAIIEEFPLIDERGEVAYTWDTSTEPPTKEDNDNWIPTYDLNAAAAEVWEEKAAALEDQFDFKDAGADYARSQKFDHAKKMARTYRSKRASSSTRLYAEAI